MFGEFLRRLTQPDPAPLPDSDARLAISAMLVRVARTDGHMADSESNQINRILKARFDLNEADTKTLRANAEILESEAPDTVRFTRAIKDAIPYGERAAVIEALWQVVLADGVRDSHENALLRLVANLLGINDRDSARARQRVEAAETGRGNRKSAVS